MFVPSNIHSTRPIVFCWDNNDLQEVTPCGGHTTHCANGIVIKRCSPAESFSSVNGQQMPTFPVKRPCHRRSIQCTAVQELHYGAGSRGGPACGEHHYVADSASLCLEAPSAGQLYLLLSRLRDCSLRLGRATEGTPQAISPRSAFNASSMNFKIFQHTSHNIRIISRRFGRIQCFWYMMFHSAAISATFQSFLLL